jgi:hypothetical protein
MSVPGADEDVGEFAPSIRTGHINDAGRLNARSCTPPKLSFRGDDEVLVERITPSALISCAWRSEAMQRSSETIGTITAALVKDSVFVSLVVSRIWRVRSAKLHRALSLARLAANACCEDQRVPR